MTLVIQYSKQAAHFLKKADKVLAKRILSKIEGLGNEPINKDTKKIQGSKALFRVRVGHVRVLYEINYEEKQVSIVKIDKRDSVYD